MNVHQDNIGRMTASAVLEVSALNFEYPGKRALTDVSFTLPYGAVLALGW